MRHGIGCNIVDVANQLSFAYRGIAPELRVFVSPPTESTKVADFIRALEEKQEAHLPWRGPERPAGLTHSALVPAPQQPWRPSDRLANNSPDGLRRQAPPPFRQTFMPQRQHYPTNNQRYQKPSSPAGANRHTALRGGQITQSTSCAPGNATNHPQAAPYQAIPRQPYQSGQSQRVYQHVEEKGVYQVDDKDFENRPKGFYTTFDPEGEEVDYSDEGFQEVIANFVGIET
ncbi:hypothetical protein MMC31_006945, partial [Peltigera leucophlebia]|nr:hypothetical protein [Peltigera leucophlebia]